MVGVTLGERCDYPLCGHALSDPTDACWIAGAIYWQVYIAVARLIDWLID